MMHRLVARTAALGALLATALPASAHPGHGATDASSLLHVIVEPEHAMWLAAAAAAAIALAISRFSARSRSS